LAERAHFAAGTGDVTRDPVWEPPGDAAAPEKRLLWEFLGLPGSGPVSYTTALTAQRLNMELLRRCSTNLLTDFSRFCYIEIDNRDHLGTACAIAAADRRYTVPLKVEGSPDAAHVGEMVLMNALSGSEVRPADPGTIVQGWFKVVDVRRIRKWTIERNGTFVPWNIDSWSLSFPSFDGAVFDRDICIGRFGSEVQVLYSPGNEDPSNVRLPRTPPGSGTPACSASDRDSDSWFHDSDQESVASSAESNDGAKLDELCLRLAGLDSWSGVSEIDGFRSQLVPIGRESELFAAAPGVTGAPAVETCHADMNVYTSHGDPQRFCYLCDAWLSGRETFNEHLLSKKHRRCLDRRLIQLAEDYLFQHEVVQGPENEFEAQELSLNLRSTCQNSMTLSKFLAICPVCQTCHLPVTTDPFDEHYHWVSEKFCQNHSWEGKAAAIRARLCELKSNMNRAASERKRCAKTLQTATADHGAAVIQHEMAASVWDNETNWMIQHYEVSRVKGELSRRRDAPYLSGTALLPPTVTMADSASTEVAVLPSDLRMFSLTQSTTQGGLAPCDYPSIHREGQGRLAEDNRPRKVEPLWKKARVTIRTR